MAATGPGRKMQPKAKKPVVPLEQYSKAELIAQVKKLQKQVAKHDGAIALARLGQRVTHVEPGEDAVSDLVPQDEAAKLPGVGPCKPFPWEPK